MLNRKCYNRVEVKRSHRGIKQKEKQKEKQNIKEELKEKVKEKVNLPVVLIVRPLKDKDPGRRFIRDI